MVGRARALKKKSAAGTVWQGRAASNVWGCRLLKLGREDRLAGSPSAAMPPLLGCATASRQCAMPGLRPWDVWGVSPAPPTLFQPKQPLIGVRWLPPGASQTRLGRC